MIEKTLRIERAVFQKSATKAAQYPGYPYPEFAFMGRSNVGKSSLLGMILSGKAQVKVSSRPGHTQTINFFVVNESLSFADLPGFGYAVAPGAVKDSFKPMISEYIRTRENLRIVFLLVDSRRTPGDFEKDVIADLAERGIPTAVIATKTDKMSKNQLVPRLVEIAQVLEISKEDIFLTSSLKKTGKHEILKLISQFCERPRTKNQDEISE